MAVDVSSSVGDKKNRVVDVAADPAPWFAVVEETVMLPPAAPLLGTVNAVVSRSGLVTVSGWMVIAADEPLFDSFDSASVLSPSAWASTKYAI